MSGKAAFVSEMDKAAASHVPRDLEIYRDALADPVAIAGWGKLVRLIALIRPGRRGRGIIGPVGRLDEALGALGRSLVHALDVGALASDCKYY